MRQMFLGIKLLVVAASITSVQVEASFNSKECEEKFLGKVTNVSDSLAPFSPYKKLDVVFEDTKSKEKKTVQVLKNGGMKFFEGNVYEVGLQDGLLCNLQKIQS